MTTYQGLPGNRSSSRVLHPPGGSDSNIFGTDEPPVNTHKRRVVAQPPSNDIFGPPTTQNPPPKHREDTGTNIFGISTNPHVTSTEVPEQNDYQKQDDQREQAVKNQNQEQSLSESAKTFAKRMQQGSYNPITGEGGEDPAANKSSRHVRQPPGGFSSKLW